MASSCVKYAGLHVDKLRTTAYKASTNAVAERFHRTVKSGTPGEVEPQIHWAVLGGWRAWAGQCEATTFATVKAVLCSCAQSHTKPSSCQNRGSTRQRTVAKERLRAPNRRQ